MTRFVQLFAKVAQKPQVRLGHAGDELGEPRCEAIRAPGQRVTELVAESGRGNGFNGLRAGRWRRKGQATGSQALQRLRGASNAARLRGVGARCARERRKRSLVERR